MEIGNLTGLNRKGNECYFTKKEIVENLMSKIDFTGYTKIIEPAAGTGVFLEFLEEKCDNLVSYDIHPLHSDTIQANYLETKIKKEGKILVVGNPPFGRQSSLAKKFIKHSNKFASTVAFILPRSFKKDSMTKCFNLFFHKVFEEDLPKNSFLLEDGRQHDVPCVFQIWERKETKRILKPIEIENENYLIVKKEKIEDHVIAFKRVGGKAGTFYYDNLNSLSKETHIFIKIINNEILSKEVLEKLIWETKDHTVGVLSISKQELILKLNGLKK